MLRRYTPWMLWGFVLWGTLQINRLHLPGSHAVCGPWGCGPPIEALLTCHIGWIVLLSPVTFFLVTKMSPQRLHFWGCCLTGLGAIGVIGVGVYEALVWLPQADEWLRSYFFRRWWFSLITLTDYPILQTVLLGTVLWRYGNEWKIASATSTASA